ncbi:MAG: Uma2 family endonuclease [Planctomycetaceae bacterium]|nr:Uma2 family endonuclease [Planctomycetaceae bacterium]
MSIAQQLITAEQFAAMKLDGPAELVRGEIVYLHRRTGNVGDLAGVCRMPQNYHGYVTAAIVGLLFMWNHKRGLGLLLSNDSWVVTENDPDSVRGPDVIYIRRDKLPTEKLQQGVLRFPPDLVVEVLSPSDRWPDVLDKVSEYLRSGIGEVWVVDPDQRVLDIHRADQMPEHLTAADTLSRPELLPGFSCPVAELFADI